MSKKLIICFDGTWNSADSDGAETNVALLARSIHATVDTGGTPQLVLYLRGVGSTGLTAQRIVDGATGLGVDDNIRSGYMFLAQNYLPGDAIYLFGFSRGAFTARSLAGLIGSCGLLKRQKLGDLGKAWRYYKEQKERSPEDFVQVYATQSHLDVEIMVMGVWDTVGALGIPTHIFNLINQQEYGFHNTTPSKITRHAFHAMAIDESRDEFVPTLWTGAVPPNCEIEQVWFAGAHSDVGGGYSDRPLADIPLLWMANKAKDCGLALDWSVLPQSTDPTAPRHDSRAGWALKDRLTPTFRQVCEKPIKVAFYETLYQPLDQDGNPERTINEFIHPSVVARYAKPALFSPDDIAPIRTQEIYKPRNLVPLFNGSSVRKTTPVAS